MPLSSSPLPLTAIDFESTGPVAGYPDDPWQIGLVEFAPRAPAFPGPDAWTDAWLHIPLGRPFNPYAPGRHAEVRDQLAAAFPFSRQWPRLAPKLLPPRILVSHNASTGRRFLARLAPLTPFPCWIDTLRLARAALPGLSSYALQDVAAAANLLPDLARLLPARTWHDALYDALASALFLRWLLAQPGWSALDLPHLVRLSATTSSP